MQLANRLEALPDTQLRATSADHEESSKNDAVNKMDGVMLKPWPMQRAIKVLVRLSGEDCEQALFSSSVCTP